MLRVSTPRGGFRPSARSRVRIAVGVLLSLAAIGVILLVFATADRRVPVMQALGDVPAGAQISADMFRPVEVSAEPSLQVVRLEDLEQYVGSYAKVRIAAGTLLSPFHVQSDPLVGPNAAVVAINVDQGLLPKGMRIGVAETHGDDPARRRYRPAYPADLGNFQLLYAGKAAPRSGG